MKTVLKRLISAHLALVGCISLLYAGDLQTSKKVIELTSPEEYVNLFAKEREVEQKRELLTYLPYMVRKTKAGPESKWVKALLVKSLEKGEPGVQIKAAEICGEFGSAVFLENLENMYNAEAQFGEDRNLKVMVAGVKAIGLIGGQRAQEFIQQILEVNKNYPSPEVEEALSAVGDNCMVELLPQVIQYEEIIRARIENGDFEKKKSISSPEHIASMTESIRLRLLNTCTR